jgi:hypothetical protein
LDANQIRKACPPERADRPFQLPGCGVRAGHREMPGDVIF